eukprot:Rmarinus@m.22393
MWFLPERYAVELRQMWKLATPLSIIMVLEWLLTLITTSLIGRYRSDDTDAMIGGAGLSQLWQAINLLFAVGMLSAMDCQVAQAFGAGLYDVVGLVLQRGIIFSFLISIPMSFAFYYTEQIMLACGQNELTSYYAGLYSVGSIPGIFPFLCYNCLLKYLQGQNIMRPSMVVGTIVTSLHFPVSWLCIYGSQQWVGLGYTGAAVGLAISRCLLPILTGSYIYAFQLHASTWYGWSLEAFDWSSVKWFLWLGLPAAIHVVVECSGFEGMSFVMGYTTTAELAGMMILCNLYIILWMFPQGVGSAATTRVGLFIGAGEVETAKVAVRVCLCSAMVVSIIIGGLVCLGRREIASLFTRDDAVLDIVAGTLPIAVVAFVLDSFQCACGGVLRALGRPLPGAISNVVAYYVISLPLGVYLVFRRGMSCGAMWMALCISLVFIAIVLLSVLLSVDFQEEAQKAAEMLNEIAGGDVDDIDLVFAADDDDDHHIPLVGGPPSPDRPDPLFLPDEEDYPAALHNIGGGNDLGQWGGSDVESGSGRAGRNGTASWGDNGDPPPATTSFEIDGAAQEEEHVPLLSRFRRQR